METKEKKGRELARKYFKEAREWEEDTTYRTRKSERRAWHVAITAVVIAVLEGVAIACMAPLKTVEPFVIRVDNNTGLVDVVSVLAETDGKVKTEATEAMDKYWLGQYILHRERYNWDTRDYDRSIVGILSASSIQQEYATFTDPKRNPSAPVTVYGKNAEVSTNIKSISIINSGETVNKEKRLTALVRYTKTVKRPGEVDNTTQWGATITFVYRNSAMKVEDRLKNPLGFQVVGYRNDQESLIGG
ncbi:MAG: VirB8/TrbF family protein [Geobacteraceae bacterium]|nr:VirB8/TrbF family protein [Geobacteraceae bacterium]